MNGEILEELSNGIVEIINSNIEKEGQMIRILM